MIDTKRNKENNLISLALSTIGFVFILFYIFKASSDVVSSDYIRIVNYYLYDVTDLKYLLSWESISRIPFAFLARFINVTFFKYSVNFDRILGIFGLFIFNFISVKFILNTLNNRVIKIIISIITTFISYSLILWEMILNGSGYPHFIMTGIIAITFYLFSKTIDSKKYTSYASYLGLYLIITIGSLCFGGQYSVSFLCTLMLFSALEILTFVLLKDSYKSISHKIKIHSFIIIILLSFICLACFLKSNNTGEALIPVGFKDITLSELLLNNPKFPLRFLLKSLASSIVGVETLNYALEAGKISERTILVIGFVYLCSIVIALSIVISKIIQNNERTKFTLDLNSYGNIFPLMYVTYGIANYLLIFLSRYKFVRDDYGMSSRYGIQYMFLLVGIIIIFAKYIDEYVASKICYKDDKSFKSATNHIFNGKGRFLYDIAAVLCILSIAVFLYGHGITAKDEIHKAKYRKAIYEDRIEKAKIYDTLSDKELESYFEFRRGPEQIRSAFSTLKKQHLNVFK